MPSFCVVVHFDVFKNFCLGIRQAIKSPILQQLHFKAAETGFHEGNVIRIISPSHALQQMTGMN